MTFLFLLSVLILGAAYESIFIVREREVVILELLGKYSRNCHAGLAFKIPFLERKVKTLSLKINQLSIPVDTKTQDNVFCQVVIDVQLQIKDPVHAYYALGNPEEQITSFVLDSARSAFAKLDLDEAFSEKDRIAANVQEYLADKMESYGYSIISLLVTDIDPAEDVKVSMNAINAAQRKKVAAIQEGEAEKVRLVKKAEGEAEARKLHGKGIADERKEIAEGLAEQLKMLEAHGHDQRDVETLLITAMHLETLATLGAKGNVNTLFMPAHPGAAVDIRQQVTESLLAAKQHQI